MPLGVLKTERNVITREDNGHELAGSINIIVNLLIKINHMKSMKFPFEQRELQRLVSRSLQI